MSNDAELIKWMCFHLIFNSRLKCVRAICFCILSLPLCYYGSFFACAFIFESISLSFHIGMNIFFFSLFWLWPLLLLVLVLFCISSYLFRLFFVLDEWASVIWWGLICLVKHANSSKGLFKITNLVCLFDSPSPFIYCRFANHKNQLKKGLPGWLFGYSIICLFTFIYTRTLSFFAF